MSKERCIVTRLLFCIAALSLMTACLAPTPTWYEDRCLRLGFKKGSADFDSCIQRDQRWDHENEMRAQDGIGP